MTSNPVIRRNKTDGGYDALITCSSKANPPVGYIIWFHGASKITTNTTKHALINTEEKDGITTTSMLIIKNVHRSDYGTYQCTATTDAGSSSSVINFALSCE